MLVKWNLFINGIQFYTKTKQSCIHQMGFSIPHHLFVNFVHIDLLIFPTFFMVYQICLRFTEEVWERYNDCDFQTAHKAIHPTGLIVYLIETLP